MNKFDVIKEFKTQVDKIITRRLFDIANTPIVARPSVWTELTDLKNKINKL